MYDHDDDSLSGDDVEFRLDSLVHERNALLAHYRETHDDRLPAVIDMLDNRIKKLSDRL